VQPQLWEQLEAASDVTQPSDEILNALNETVKSNRKQTPFPQPPSLSNARNPEGRRLIDWVENSGDH